MKTPIPFIDLATQRDRIREKVDRRMAGVLDHGAFILGPEIRELEAALSTFGDMRHTLSCGSGTDALALPLMAWGIRPGDVVFCPSFTFAATAEVVAWLGATPFFVDVDEATFNMRPENLEEAISQAKQQNLRLKAIIAVDLFGQPADYAALRSIADRHGMKLISDAAQGYGGRIDGKLSSAWADVVATSFFPAKPLGCYGDGGAVQTNDDELQDVMSSLRVHGQNLDDKYDNIRIGMNGRMDTLQAAILLEKLAIFPDEIEARGRIARRYHDMLSDVVAPQALLRDAISTWAQYTVRLPKGSDRTTIAGALRHAGVPTAIYYPKPLHQQTAYRHFPVSNGELKVSDALSRDVISLPMHAYLDEATQDHIVDALKAALVQHRH